MRTDEDSQCAYHSADASLEDMIYDVGRILYAEYPPIVQDYVATITDKFKTTWQLPPLITSVGLSEDVVLKLRCIRAACVLEMFDFLAHSPGSGSGTGHVTSLVLSFFYKKKQINQIHMFAELAGIYFQRVTGQNVASQSLNRSVVHI